MRSPVQIVGILLLTSLFIIFLSQAFQFTRGCGCAGGRPTAREGFSARPTTPSQCQCLAGYLPSNTSSSPFGGRFLHFNGILAFAPSGSSTKYPIPSCDMGCGVNACDPTIYQNVDEAEWNSYSMGETFTCAIMTQAQQTAVKGTEIFFCQNVKDKLKTMPCY